MEPINELVELMKETVKMQKIIIRPILKDLIKESLDKPEKLLVFELTDGRNSREMIMKKTKAGAGTISGWWMEWFAKGLLEKEGSKYKKIISLEELGINTPKLQITPKVEDEFDQKNKDMLKERIIENE